MPNLRLLFDWTLYRLALLLAAPLIPLRLLWRGRRERGYRQHRGERLALGPAATRWCRFKFPTGGGAKLGATLEAKQ